MTHSRVVVVTGASAGVGRATALAFARRGAALGLIARRRNGLEATAREVRAIGARALVLPLDVADSDHVDGAADAVERELGGMDVWVNNALLPWLSPVRRLRPAEFRRAAATSYLGGVHGMLAAVHRMVPRNRGVIVQVGSSVAPAMPLWAAWRATKQAIQGFIASLRSELVHDQSQVRVTTVHLPELEPLPAGWTGRLPVQRPAPRVLPPEAAARAIVYAAEHDVGQDLVVGWSGSARRPEEARAAHRRRFRSGLRAWRAMRRWARRDGGRA
ncbi:MAG TPA: SDR family oxidoreductase [Gemmatimonadales bacterium]|nr:SDR family oxidoreductase [Gemmatimonadales bacterium]